jgi:hypothetical protein
LYFTADDEPAHTSVADEDVCSLSDQHVLQAYLAGHSHGFGELVWGARTVEEVRRSAHAKGCHRSERNVTLQARGAQAALEQIQR